MHLYKSCDLWSYRRLICDLFIGIAASKRPRVSPEASTSGTAVDGGFDFTENSGGATPPSDSPGLSQTTPGDRCDPAATGTDSSGRACEWHVSSATGVKCKPRLLAAWSRNSSHMSLSSSAGPTQRPDRVWSTTQWWSSLILHQLHPVQSVSCPPLLPVDCCYVMQINI